jgi:hypothetical protein
VTPSLSLHDAAWTGEQPDCEVADTLYVVVFRSEIVGLTIHRPEAIAAFDRRLGRGFDSKNQSLHNCPELEAILGLRGSREIDMLDGMRFPPIKIAGGRLHGLALRGRQKLALQFRNPLLKEGQALLEESTQFRRPPRWSGAMFEQRGQGFKPTDDRDSKEKAQP